MKIEFLWDEEKTRRLHKRQLLVNVVGSFAGMAYAFLSPGPTIGRVLLGITSFALLPTSLINLITINKPNQGIRFLAIILLIPLLATVFMANTGNFQSIASFVLPITLLLTQFTLGSTAALIVGSFILLNCLGLLIWGLSQNDPNVMPNFILYTSILISVFIFQRTVGNEISLQIEARKKLEQVDDLKNQFISLASHYLRTPLTLLKASLSELGKTELQANQEKSLHQAHVSTIQLDNLTEKLLLISSIERGQAQITPMPGDLDGLLSRLEGEFGESAQIHQVSLKYYPPKGPIPKVDFDSIKLRGVISHLLDNAVKFNKTGGEVNISLQFEQEEAIIKISDTGVGISPQHLETLFTSFNKGGMKHTLKFDQPGMGLSLYLTKLIIEAHHGTVDVDSKEDKGTTFTVTVPIHFTL